MENITFLQLFLLLNVFIMGALAATALRHAYAHFKPDHHDADKIHAKVQKVQLPPATRKHLLESAEEDFQSVLEKSTVELQRELQTTAAVLNKQLAKTGAEIVGYEMERYRTQLENLRKQADDAIGGAQTEVVQHQNDLKSKIAEAQLKIEAQLAEEMKLEKQRLIQQMDTKLADAVASFLTETLQHNVDLGAQSSYLTAMLEEYKTELIKGATDEA